MAGRHFVLDFMFLVLASLCISVPWVLAQNACSDPNNQQGTCIKVTTCPALLAILSNRQRTAAETTFLRNAQCGFEGREPKVCCAARRANPPAPIVPVDTNYNSGGGSQGTSSRGPITSNLLPPRDQCGQDGGSDRIFGGENTSIDDYPWMGIIQYRTKKGSITNGCGASLINSRYLLTAGHCVKGEVLTALGTPINVVLGEYDRSQGVDCITAKNGDQDCNEEPVTINIEKTIPHPDYLTRNLGQKHDIALLRLASPAPSNNFFIKPVCLPDSDFTADGFAKETVVSGWGQTEAGKGSQIKQHVKLPLVDFEACKAVYGGQKFRTNLWDKQVCAGGQPGKDSCRGDSGGPLMFKGSGESYVLHGVVSFGPTPCALNGVPGVYTKVFSYMDWIVSELKP